MSKRTDNVIELGHNEFRVFSFCVDNAHPVEYSVCREDYLAMEKREILKRIDMSEHEFELAVDNLWKDRLLVRLSSNEYCFYIVNAYKLGWRSKEEFIKDNFFAHSFFTERKENTSSEKRNRRKRMLTYDFTEEQKLKVLERFGNKCALTGKDVPLHFDHVIPIACERGGTTVSNMLPIWQRINSSKGAKNIFVWYEENGERFDVCPNRFTKVIEYLAELNEMTSEEYREYVYECHAKPNEIN